MCHWRLLCSVCEAVRSFGANFGHGQFVNTRKAAVRRSQYTSHVHSFELPETTKPWPGKSREA